MELVFFHPLVMTSVMVVVIGNTAGGLERALRARRAGQSPPLSFWSLIINLVSLTEWWFLYYLSNLGPRLVPDFRPPDGFALAYLMLTLAWLVLSCVSMAQDLYAPRRGRRLYVVYTLLVNAVVVWTLVQQMQAQHLL